MSTPRMSFSGNNLMCVRNALAGAISDCRMQVGSCPDINVYAEDIEDLEAEIAGYERLLRRVDTKLGIETPTE